MNKYNIKWTRVQNEIFRLFCTKTGKKLSQRQIAKLLEISPTSVGKSLELLENEGIILKDKSKERNLSLIKLNTSNKNTVELKRAENLKILYQSNLIDYLEEKFPGSTIILFGSYSRGEDIHNSDIDIAIIGNKKKQIDLSKYEKFLEKEIRINFYNNLNKINKNLKYNLFNGINLIGEFY